MKSKRSEAAATAIAASNEKAILSKFAELEKIAAPRAQLATAATAAAKSRDEFILEIERARIETEKKLGELINTAHGADAILAAAETAYRQAQIIKFENPELFDLEEIENFDGFTLRNVCGDTISFRDPTAPELFVTMPVFLREQLSREKRMDAARRKAIHEHESAMQEWNDRNKFVSFLLRKDPPALREVVWADVIGA